jgi:hypothetical protein
MKKLNKSKILLKTLLMALILFTAVAYFLRLPVNTITVNDIVISDTEEQQIQALIKR